MGEVYSKGGFDPNFNLAAERIGARASTTRGDGVHEQLQALRRAGEHVLGKTAIADHLAINVILESGVNSPSREILEPEVAIVIDVRAGKPGRHVRLASGVSCK